MRKRLAEGFPITRACKVAGVSRQGFYDGVAKSSAGPTASEVEEAVLVEEIRAIHDEFDQTQGSPCVTVELANQGRCVNHKRVERLMRDHRIVGVHKPARVRTTTPAEDSPPIPDGGPPGRPFASVGPFDAPVR